jgi:hypothetical protein
LTGRNRRDIRRAKSSASAGREITCTAQVSLPIGIGFAPIFTPTAGSACYFIIIIIVIRHETTAAARRALLLIVRTLSNDAITVAVWTGFGFHMCLPVDVSIEWRRG